MGMSVYHRSKAVTKRKDIRKMKYDFTTIMNRSGQDAVAADKIPMEGVSVKEGFSKIPMWVADMNYPTLPTITQAMQARIQEPHFGYFDLRDEYYESIQRWQEIRNGVTGIKKEDIGYENGVLGCIASAVNAFTAPGEAVLLHSPTYIGFTKTLKNNGRDIVLSELKRDEEGVWRMDYEDMEQKLVEHRIHCVVFCSPHNPTGRVWEQGELERALELYKKHDCVVISDEIWSDLVLPGYHHIPTQSVSEDARMRTIAVYAPSKTFNLAGLVGSYHIIYNPTLRDRVEKVSSMSHYNMVNVLSQYALIGAYQPEGCQWVDELVQVIGENVKYACHFIQEHFEGVELAVPQGTYLLYLDCSKWCKKHKKSVEELLKAGIEVGVIWQDGRPFHQPDSIRMNLALPEALVREAFDRLEKYVFS